MTNRPEIVYQAGQVKLTVWKNKGKDDAEFASYNIKKSYKDKDGQWQDTPYLSDGDLKNLRTILDKVLTDQVKYHQPKDVDFAPAEKPMGADQAVKPE